MRNLFPTTVPSSDGLSFIHRAASTVSKAWGWRRSAHSMPLCCCPPCSSLLSSSRGVAASGPSWAPCAAMWSSPWATSTPTGTAPLAGHSQCVEAFPGSQLPPSLAPDPSGNPFLDLGSLLGPCLHTHRCLHGSNSNRASDGDDSQEDSASKQPMTHSLFPQILRAGQRGSVAYVGTH